MLENVVEKSFSVSPLVGFLVVAIIGLGLALIHIYKKTDEKLDKKDALNREFTNKLVDNLNTKVDSLEDERKSDKKVIQDMVNTNKQLADTNAKLYSTIDTKIENMDKKVDKIEILVERINRR